MKDYGNFQEGCHLGQDGKLVCPSDMNNFAHVRRRTAPVPG